MMKSACNHSSFKGFDANFQPLCGTKTLLIIYLRMIYLKFILESFVWYSLKWTAIAFMAKSYL